MRTCTLEGCSKRHEAHGWCDMHYARWKRTGDPLGLVTAPRGTAIDGFGYRKYAGKLEHISVAEKAFGGPLPKGSIVHHVDENKTNNTPTNLVVCSRAYHKLIHQRTDAMNACGNPSWRKCKICGRYSQKDELSGFGNVGTSGYHNTCRRDQYALKKAISDGYEVPGAHIVKKDRLEIKG